MKNLLTPFLDQKTHRKTLNFSVKIKNVINSLPQIKGILILLDLVFQKFNKRDNEKLRFLLSIYI